MICPLCGDEGADAGFSSVYCPNIDCSNFDEQRLKEVVAKAEEEFMGLNYPVTEELDQDEVHDIFQSILNDLLDFCPGQRH